MNENIDKHDKMQAKCDIVNEKLFDISKRLNEHFELGEIEQCTLDSDSEIEIQMQNRNVALQITQDLEIAICIDIIDDNDPENNEWQFIECSSLNQAIERMKYIDEHYENCVDENDPNLFDDANVETDATNVPSIEQIQNDIEMENDVDDENELNEKMGITNNEPDAKPVPKTIDYTKLTQKQLRNNLRKKCNIYVGQFQYAKTDDDEIIVTTNHVHVDNFKIDENVDDFKRDMFINLLKIHSK